MVEEEEKNLFGGIEKRGRKEIKKERNKKEIGKEEVAYTPRGRVLILLEIPLSRGHSMAMELSHNIRAG